MVLSATDLKTALAAGVPADLLAARGPVSAETAAAIARACALAPGHLGGLLTGVAGPEPVDGHGPGRVYVGTSDAGRTEVLELDLAGDRAAVRAGAVSAAVAGLLARLRRRAGRSGPRTVLRQQRTSAGRSGPGVARRVP